MEERHVTERGRERQKDRERGRERKKDKRIARMKMKTKPRTELNFNNYVSFTTAQGMRNRV